MRNSNTANSVIRFSTFFQSSGSISKNKGYHVCLDSNTHQQTKSKKKLNFGCDRQFLKKIMALLKCGLRVKGRGLRVRVKGKGQE